MVRLLIADDEESIRAGVTEFVTRHCPGYEVVAQAVDGRDALRLAQETLPDVVLTDIMMPHMNGLDFLESLAAILPEAKLVVLSGYDQFEYAAQALRLGVREYLVKPLDTAQLETILARFAGELEQQERQWRQRDDWRREQEKVARMEQAQFCHAALTGAPLPALHGAAQRLAASGGQWLCVLCDGQGEDAAFLEELVAQRLYGEADAALVYLGSPPVAAFALRFTGISRGPLFLSLSRSLTAVAIQAKRARGLNLHFFLGDVVDAPDRLHHSYRQSRQAYGYAFLESTGPVTTYEDVLANRLTPFTRPPRQLVQTIQEAVRAESKTGFRQGSDGLFAWFSGQGVRDANFIRLCVLELCLSLLEEEDPAAVPMSYLEFTNVQNEISSAPSLAELRACLENFVNWIWLRRQRAQPQPPGISQRVEALVQQRLGDSEFSLDDVAGELFISPNYLRQLFKQETGRTFVDYLTEQRMLKARLLLGNPKLKVGDAAQEVGYTDARYFSVVFKKWFHQTPSEYQAGL